MWDRVVGEPPAALHPVVWFGRLMDRVEAVLWCDRRPNGALHTAAGVVAGAGFGKLAGSGVCAGVATTGLAVAGRELRRVAALVGDRLAAGRLDLARAELPSLVGRDPSGLDEAGVAAAVVESLAENTVDAVVAPIFWSAVAGAWGVGAYRAVNTMDAMVGHRSARFERYGWASARLDDAANWVPARLTALLVVLVRPWSAPAVWRAVRDDAPDHPSPNAGVAEAAFAAALGVELGGTLRYGERVEHRPLLGAGPRPGADDVAAAVRLADHTERALFVLLATAAWLSWWRRRR